MRDSREIVSFPEGEPLCTYRGVADAWECDQMQHMNVKFIAERFSRADNFLFASLGVGTDQAAPVMTLQAEQLTFRKEVKPGRPLLIESRILPTDSDTYLVRHDLKFADSSEVSASTVARICATRPIASLRSAIGERLDGDECWDLVEPVIDGEVLNESGRSFAGATDRSNDGDLHREALVRLIAHASSCAGIDRGRRWGADGQLSTGSAMLAMSIRRRSPLPPSVPILLRSCLKARSAKTLTVLHQVLDATTSVVAVEAASTHVFFDIASRSATPIPSDVSSLIAEQYARPMTTDHR